MVCCHRVAIAGQQISFAGEFLCESRRGLENTLAGLGLVRRKNDKPRRQARTSRRMVVEDLEKREMLSGVQLIPLPNQVFWDPTMTGHDNPGGTFTVSGGGGVWTASSENFFNPGTNRDVAPGPGQTVVFAGQTGTVTISGTVTATDIAVETANYKIAGGTLDLSPPDGSPGVVTVGSTGSAASATISSSLADGGAGITVQGNGALLLDGNNTISGSITADSSVIFGQPSAMPSAGALNINPGGHVTLGMPTLYADAGGGTEDWATADIWRVGGAYGPLTTWIDGSYATLGGGGGTLDLSTPVIASSLPSLPTATRSTVTPPTRSSCRRSASTRRGDHQHHRRGPDRQRRSVRERARPTRPRRRQ